MRAEWLDLRAIHPQRRSCLRSAHRRAISWSSAQWWRRSAGGSLIRAQADGGTRQARRV